MRDFMNNVVSILMAIIGVVILALLLNKSGAAGNLISTSSVSFGNLLTQASNAGSGGLGTSSLPNLGGIGSPFSGG